MKLRIVQNYKIIWFISIFLIIILLFTKSSTNLYHFIFSCEVLVNILMIFLNLTARIQLYPKFTRKSMNSVFILRFLEVITNILCVLFIHVIKKKLSKFYIVIAFIFGSFASVTNLAYLFFLISLIKIYKEAKANQGITFYDLYLLFLRPKELRKLPHFKDAAYDVNEQDLIIIIATVDYELVIVFNKNEVYYEVRLFNIDYKIFNHPKNLSLRRHYYKIDNGDDFFIENHLSNEAIMSILKDFINKKDNEINNLLEEIKKTLQLMKTKN